MALTVLAEAESIQAYQRKRLAISFETPPKPKKAKLHSSAIQNHSWSHDDAQQMLLNHPAKTAINWSLLAKKLIIPGKNGGQALKEFATGQGFDTLALENKSSPTPVRERRHFKKLPGGEISIPALPTPAAIISEKNKLIASGKLSLGEPCSPHKVVKTSVTSEGEVRSAEVNIIGRKLSLKEIRKKLLDRHKKYMRLMTNEQIKQLTRDEIIQMMAIAHYAVPPNATLSPLQHQLATLQRTRTLAFWHDHSTVLQQGYILFAVKVVYDTGVFLTEKEHQTKDGTKSVQEIVEQPVVHMIAPSTSAVSDQLALISDRLECLKELSEPINDQNGISIMDKARFFCGDKPAQQFERGTQIGGVYKCGSCGCKDHLMQDLAHAIHCPPRSLATLQTLITNGKLGKQAGKLKPLDKLLLTDLKDELNVRGFNTTNLRKPEMQELLTSELKGAQRVPSLLILDPTQQLDDLNLKEYEVLDCEPLHDLKGHTYNLLQEVPHIVLPSHKQIITQIIESTTKETSSGVHLRVAAIKVYLKLLHLNDVDSDLRLLLGTLVKISELVYLPESRRNPKTVLQLYNATWLHHELCCHLIPNPKTQTRDKFYGIYLHDLVVHAPMQYEMVSLRSTNAESTERLFSQIKHISLRATNRKPDNVLTTILLSLQTKEETGTSTTISSIHKQGSMVTEVAKRIPQYSGTVIPKSFIKPRISSWQAHLSRISAYLKPGEGVWWEGKQDQYIFHDSDSDSPFQPQGPGLNHFRNTNITSIWTQSKTEWDYIIKQTNTKLPIPFIKTFSSGHYTGRKYYLNDAEGDTTSDSYQAADLDPTTIYLKNTDGSKPAETTPTPTQTIPDTSTQSSVNTSLSVNPNTYASQPAATIPTPTTPGPSTEPTNYQFSVNTDLSLSEVLPATSDTTYNSKAAILICKVIGKSSLLEEFDKMRLKLRNYTVQKEKPPISEIAKYKTLQLQLRDLLATKKLSIKENIKTIEHTHYNIAATLPSQSVEYGLLRKKLDSIRKVLGLWHKFNL